MDIFSVRCGQVEYVSNEPTALDAAGEILDKTFNGCIMGHDLIVTNMMTGEVDVFDTNDILEELGFEYE